MCALVRSLYTCLHLDDERFEKQTRAFHWEISKAFRTFLIENGAPRMRGGELLFLSSASKPTETAAPSKRSLLASARQFLNLGGSKKYTSNPLFIYFIHLDIL